MAFPRALAGLVVGWLLLAPAAAKESRVGGADSLALTYRALDGVTLTVVTVDLNSQRLVVRPLLAPRGRPRPARDLVAPAPPLAAITGTFFDVRTATVVGSIAAQGRLLEEGALGSTLAIDRQGRARLLPHSGTSRLGRYRDWSPYDFAISSGPTLVHRGRLAVNPGREGFRDPGLFGPRRRTALGVTRNNRLLLVGVERPVDIHRLARLMRALGAVEAVNLDGGTSAALYHRGQWLLQPKRKLTNLVVALKPDQARYHSALAEVERDFGHLRKAVDHYLRASSLYLTGHKPEQALTLARRATQAAAWRMDAQLMLARTARQAGQRELARRALKTVLARHPGHPSAARLLNSLRS